MTKSPEAFRTISEVAELLETPAHVLRFWESRFPQIRPVKRAGGRRYYRPADVALLTGIRHLLHDEGMTIRGVQKILREQGVRHVSGMTDDSGDAADDAALEAALAASGGRADPDPPLPPAEAETAQIIALQTALRPAAPEAMKATDPREMPPLAPEATAMAPQDDLFARLNARAPDGPEIAPPIVEEVVSRQDVADTSSFSETPDPTPLPPQNPATDEAPMAVWADQVPSDSGPGESGPGESGPGESGPVDFKPADPVQADPVQDEPVVAEPVVADPAPVPPPALKITRISPQSRDTADAALPTMAQRLRATAAADLSASDRATLAVLRAKARSLRDRLGNPPRFGG